MAGVELGWRGALVQAHGRSLSMEPWSVPFRSTFHPRYTDLCPNTPVTDVAEKKSSCSAVTSGKFIVLVQLKKGDRLEPSQIFCGMSTDGFGEQQDLLHRLNAYDCLRCHGAHWSYTPPLLLGQLPPFAASHYECPRPILLCSTAIKGEAQMSGSAPTPRFVSL